MQNKINKHIPISNLSSPYIGSGYDDNEIKKFIIKEKKLKAYQIKLVEKKDEFAGETSAVFHEWMHFGSLYTLFPGLNKTLRYVLGGVDDLIEYYSCFDNMNFVKSDKGIVTDGDIRRAIEKYGKKIFELDANDIMTLNPASVEKGTRMEDAIMLMESLSISSLLIKDRNEIIGIIKK